ncbi:hypothetical protein U8607_13865 [Methylobacterium durans]|uniref:hypothetical protein n=1 Tax=Methylobacterium durans TaxID=2202825 RepID=UPI002AFDD899|nr:hypothetical protein [Methylobacterium durans]MEA1833168.1 hypothetical protein [Methylobacterium durans]
MNQGKDGGIEPKVPTERPDPRAAGRPSGGADRPGFDLGGAEDRSVQSGTNPKTEPRGNPEIGNEQPAGRSQMTSRKGTPA